MNFHEEKNAHGRWVGKFKYTRIKLKDALKFADDDWCREFFKSFQKMHDKHPGKMLLLEWDISESELSESKVEWTLIANRAGYSKEMDPEDFGRGVREDYKPNRFSSYRGGTGGGDLVMISPGKGNGTCKNGYLQGLGKGRCIHVTNYMCSGETHYEEKKMLWKMVGETAKWRIDGILKRPDHHGVDRVWGVDKDGHKTIHISTHGYGVPWLHVRVESKEQYPDQANY